MPYRRRYGLKPPDDGLATVFKGVARLMMMMIIQKKPSEAEEDNKERQMKRGNDSREEAETETSSPLQRILPCTFLGVSGRLSLTAQARVPACACANVK